MALDATALIHLDLHGPGMHSRIVNASSRGMLLVMPDARPVGTKIHITVQLDNPPDEIKVTGIIVHCNTSENVDPRFTARAGILVTAAGPDWDELCKQLAAK
ncbi:MAG TPA: PilZ domain-containing protein [Polyangia bacterium]